MKIGIYVGSFDPIHKGHIGIVKQLINNKILDKVILIPTQAYWDKNDLLSLHYRINMAKMYETDNIIVETELNELPYTYIILEELHKKYPSDELTLIIGADNLEGIHRWKNLSQILEHKIIVINRNNHNSAELIRKFNFNKNIFQLLDNPYNIDYNSTEIRFKIKNKHDVTNDLDDIIISYIKEYKLYE
jgi:nicotinate-nucleotide adenylyltransferase